MKKNELGKKYIKGAQFAFLFMLLFSCTTNASIDVNDNSSGTFLYSTQASSGVENLIRSFSGAGPSISVFDKSLIEEGFASADLRLLSFETKGTANISLSGSTENINELVPHEEQLVVFENTPTRGQLSLNINNATITSLLSLMGEENIIYLELLQAPIFNGIPMSTEDYLSFIGALYGQTMLNELRNSTVTFELSVPNNIKEVSLKPSSVGDISYTENAAKVSISLADFLANTSEIALAITW